MAFDDNATVEAGNLDATSQMHAHCDDHCGAMTSVGSQLSVEEDGETHQYMNKVNYQPLPYKLA